MRNFKALILQNTSHINHYLWEIQDLFVQLVQIFYQTKISFPFRILHLWASWGTEIVEFFLKFCFLKTMRFSHWLETQCSVRTVDTSVFGLNAGGTINHCSRRRAVKIEILVTWCQDYFHFLGTIFCRSIDWASPKYWLYSSLIQLIHVTHINSTNKFQGWNQSCYMYKTGASLTARLNLRNIQTNWHIRMFTKLKKLAVRAIWIQTQGTHSEPQILPKQVECTLKCQGAYILVLKVAILCQSFTT